MTKTRGEVFLIDASIYIFRYYFAMPDHWLSKKGYSTSAVYGYTHWLIQFLRATGAKHIAACFDESLGSCFRNAIYPEYKSSRALPDAELAYQLDSCQQISEMLGVPVYASNVYEADDLIGTLAKRCRSKGLKVGIVSRDKDLTQLVLGENDVFWDFPAPPLDARGVLDKMGVQPRQVADFLALTGDSGDDIPGVPGVGAKTACALLAGKPSWRAIKNDFPAVAKMPIRGAASLASKLETYQKQIELARKLTTICDTAALGKRFNVRHGKILEDALIAYGRELGFGKNFAKTIRNFTESR